MSSLTFRDKGLIVLKRGDPRFHEVAKRLKIQVEEGDTITTPYPDSKPIGEFVINGKRQTFYQY